MKARLQIDPEACEFIRRVWLSPGDGQAMTIYPSYEMPGDDQLLLSPTSHNNGMTVAGAIAEKLRHQKEPLKVIWSIGTVLMKNVPETFVEQCNGIPFFIPPELRDVLTNQKILLRAGGLIIDPPI